jgi:hypothetical protein
LKANSFGVSSPSKPGIAWRINSGFFCQYSARNSVGVKLFNNANGELGKLRVIFLIGNSSCMEIIATLYRLV